MLKEWVVAPLRMRQTEAMRSASGVPTKKSVL